MKQIKRLFSSLCICGLLVLHSCALFKKNCDCPTFGQVPVKEDKIDFLPFTDHAQLNVEFDLNE